MGQKWRNQVEVVRLPQGQGGERGLTLRAGSHARETDASSANEQQSYCPVNDRLGRRYRVD